MQIADYVYLSLTVNKQFDQIHNYKILRLTKDRRKLDIYIDSQPTKVKDQILINKTDQKDSNNRTHATSKQTNKVRDDEETGS